MARVSRAAPAAEPVSSAEVKEWVYMDTGDAAQDDVITDLITAARQAIEFRSNLAMVNQVITWTVDADEMQSPIWVPVGHASAITSITTFDGKAGANDVVVSAANYELVGNMIITRADGFSANQKYGAAKIIYTAGFGAAATNVPLDLKTAILLWLADHFKARETFVKGTIIGPMPVSVMDILMDGGHLWNDF